MPTRKENEMIFLCLGVTLLKKVNSTQRFSFAKESNKRRIWNNIFVFCVALLKKVNSTQENLCVLCTFFKIVSDINKNIISISFLFALLQRKISVYRLPFSKEKHSNNEIHSTNQNLCVLFTFFKRVSHKYKNIISIFFLLALFCKEKSLCTVSLFQKSKTQKYHFNFFSCCSLLQRKISVYCFPFFKE